MRQRLKSVLALLDDNSIEKLIYRFLAIKHHRLRFSTLMVAMFNANERRLDCYLHPDENSYETMNLNINIDDFSHPLVQVLRNGLPLVWDSLQQGVRIEDTVFRELVQEMPVGCGMYALPLFDFHGRACGVIAIIAVRIARFADPDGIFGVYCSVFQHRLIKLQEAEQLRTQLNQISALFASQQQREKQMDELLATLREADESSTLPGLSHDYSRIHDLPKAVEAFEIAVLTQRIRVYGKNKNRIAESLGIAPRTLAYKLTKYRCEE
ncbi:helix-turn-helix domain-containing protein [Scandinavium lactucae]|uniref:Helix-turn-helix domain-containing protein n=1 Tax=Scandinavium lactucae TaxID=3095028 RepID=A0ABU4QMS1_9ENTR|nr:MULTISPECIES: helix-turn-helix domain-containing protein [unclassified Scandinavium]MDX6040147.1 helix-turn-helix domain-containing protein [Scandinavium sp. V105_6]MDX6051182.1 helix-turn-helix domain-containing protein [Scandinavium sp. V105_1]